MVNGVACHAVVVVPCTKAIVPSGLGGGGATSTGTRRFWATSRTAAAVLVPTVMAYAMHATTATYITSALISAMVCTVVSVCTPTKRPLGSTPLTGSAPQYKYLCSVAGACGSPL